MINLNIVKDGKGTWREYEEHIYNPIFKIFGSSPSMFHFHISFCYYKKLATIIYMDKRNIFLAFL